MRLVSVHLAGVVGILAILTGCTAPVRVASATATTPVTAARCRPALEPASVILWSCTVAAGGNPLAHELSGIYYDHVSSTLWAASDDVDRRAPARLLQFALSPAPTMALRGVLSLTRQRPPVGRPAPAWQLEGLAPVLADGRWTGAFFVASERDEWSPAVASQIYRCTSNGDCVIAFGMPRQFESPASGQARSGIVDNQGLEGLTISPDGARLFASLERPLIQEAAATDRRARVRLVEFDPNQFTPLRQYAYELDPLPLNVSVPEGAPGVSEILAVSTTELLVLERSFSAACGNTIRLFGVTVDPSLALPANQPIADAIVLRKRLLLDLNDEKHAFDDPKLASRLENFEGMTFGPPLPDGAPTLLLVSDDNLRGDQITALVGLRMAALPTAAARRWRDGDPPVCPVQASR